MILLIVILGALLLDQLLGEPRRWHPLNGFAQLAGVVEKRLYDTTCGAQGQRRRGIAAVAISVLPLTALFALLSWLPAFGWLIDILVLYCAVGYKSLIEHAEAVMRPLQAQDLILARERVGYMVGRDTATMQETDISRAAIESVLENGNDAVFATLFWFLLGGAAGAVLYRLVNTLDALWGYRNERYADFGWAAARLDDVLNYIPARLAALTYAVAGGSLRALRCAWQQGRRWVSPNAGVVMASGAGALDVQLGGSASYQGVLHERIALGHDRAPVATDIQRAVGLLMRGVLLWLVLIVVSVWITTEGWYA